jgi:outer membrane protein
MGRVQTQRIAVLLALGAIAIGSGTVFEAWGAAPLTAQPRAVIANPTATVAAPPPAALAPAPQPAPAAAPVAQNGLPAPKIIVIDRNFILQRSSAGQEMVNQTQTLSKTAETELKTQEAQLQAEATQLQQQLAILAPEVRDQKEKEFTSKQQAFQGKVAQRQAEIQAGFNKAAHQLEVALEPILKAIMVERGANMVMDRSAIILSSVDVDVTPVAVQRLDKTLPHVKVELTPVPAGGAPPAGPAIAAAPKPQAGPAIVPAAPVKK